MSCERGCCPSPKEHYESLNFMYYGKGSAHQRDNALSKDREAYKRLRQNGVQPKRVDGSYKLEALANTKEQVEHGLQG